MLPSYDFWEFKKNIGIYINHIIGYCIELITNQSLIIFIKNIHLKITF